MKRIIITICAVFLFSGLVSHHTDAYQDLGEIPIQYAGRVKPFESFAREAVLYVTGKPAYEKKNPTRTVWGWMTQPEKWSKGQRRDRRCAPVRGLRRGDADG